MLIYLKCVATEQQKTECESKFASENSFCKDAQNEWLHGQWMIMMNDYMHGRWTIMMNDYMDDEWLWWMISWTMNDYEYDEWHKMNDYSSDYSSMTVYMSI